MTIETPNQVTFMSNMDTSSICIMVVHLMKRYGVSPEMIEHIYREKGQEIKKVYDEIGISGPDEIKRLKGGEN